MRKLFGRLTRWTGSERKVSVGVCAMDKKAKSKQMQEILDRLTAFGEFTIVHFSDDILLNKPIEEWPICDTLLSWHSDGFPLAKAEAYAALRRPFCINDLSQQHNLQRRFAVYKTLVAHNIPVPTHIIVQRSGPGEEVPGFVETEDYVELNGTRITKPFVEKPENAEDHNVHIYYPSSLGGGVKKLFRKINNKSSEFDVNHSGRVRRDGSYLYEEFLPTGGTDVKVYTVGARYAHAEARKSPVVDGKVLRTADGKEMRFPVLLTPQEKEIARQVVVAFKQNVCGFDLLRSEKGKSAVSCVCDVNGWSFVKNSRRFYDDAAGILRTILLGAVQPNRLAASPSPTLSFKALGNQHGLAQDDADLLSCFAADDPDMPSVDAGEVARTDTRSTDEELRCVLAVIRHGDRTPKQKLKIKVRAEALLALFAKHKDAKGKQAKLKTPGQLQELLDITRALLAVLFKGNASSQLEVLGLGKAGLAAPRGSVSSQGPEEGAGGPPLGSGEVGEAGWANTTPAPAPAPVLTDEQREQLLELREKLRIVQTVLEQASFDGINRKVQIKPLRWGLAPAPCARTPSGPLAAVSPTASTAGAQPTLTTGSFGGSAAPTPTPTPGLAHPPPGLPVALASQAPSAFITMALPPGLEPINPLAPVPAAGMGQGGCLGLGPQDSYAPGAAGAAGQGAGSTAQGSVRHSSSNQGGVPVLEEVLMVVKWGGILTHAGRQQAEDLGKVFRMVMYPRYGSAGGGLLRLHSTYRHDLKIYSSDEGRVQASAAAFAQGLLDLEGTSLTPILVSLVKKDAAMLDAFGKGASDDIRQAKSLVYEAMTHDPDKGPPPPCTLTSTGPAPDNSSEPGPTPLPGPSLSAGVGVPGGVEGGVAGKPESPLALLRRLVELLKVLVAQLRELCVQEGLNSRQASGAAAGSGPPSAPSGPSLPPLWGAGGGPQRYSSVSHGPAEWRLEPGRPCSGERMLLMYDRWQKLLKSVWNEKKGKFDISKVPDIYDSAKYDAIHNSHLGVDLQELYQVARQLARAVIPSEYGTDPLSRLRIGSKIASELLGKLLVDLAAMREESQVTQDQDDACSLADSCMLAPALAGLVLPHPPLTATYASASRPASPSKLLTGAAVGGAAGPEAGGEGASPAGPWGGAGQSARSSVGGAAAAAAGSVGGLGAGGGSRAGPSGGVLQAAALVAQQAMGLGGRLEAERSALSSTASVTSQLGSGMLAGGGGEAGGGGRRPGGELGGEEAHGHEGGEGKGGEAVGEGEGEEGSSGDEGQRSKQREAGAESEEVEAQETIHRLLPEYAPHINSPLRHVRTRIYFTSESHIHSLINVLRYCHLHSVATSSGQTAAGSDSSSSGPAPHPGAPLLPPSACTALDGCQELDYLTHLVLRLYENKTVPFGAPERFRVEMLFSPGANYDPFEVAAKAQAAQAAASQPSPPAAAHPHTPSGLAGAAAGGERAGTAAAGATDCRVLGSLAAAGSVASDAMATPASTAAAAPASHPGLDPGPPAGGATSGAAGVVSGSRPSPSQPGPAHPLPTDKPGGAVERGGPGGVKAGAKEGRGSGGVAPGGCRGPDWHVLPVVPRVLLHEGEHGMPLAYLEDALLPMAKVSKFATPGYATTLLARNNPTLGVPRSLSRIGASGGVRDSAGSAGLISHRSHVGGSDTPLSVDSCC